MLVKKAWSHNVMFPKFRKLQTHRQTHIRNTAINTIMISIHHISAECSRSGAGAFFAHDPGHSVQEVVILT